ncbi:MAG: DUF3325 domain-containing protein [Pseudoxanthomonas sp.]
MILFVALACCALGLAWLALAMDVHWQQVKGSRAPSSGTARVLRVFGTIALLASFILCFVADHATMAPLVWVMALAGGALLVAFALAWRPRLLSPLVAWLPAK